MSDEFDGDEDNEESKKESSFLGEVLAFCVTAMCHELIERGELESEHFIALLSVPGGPVRAMTLCEAGSDALAKGASIPPAIARALVSSYKRKGGIGKLLKAGRDYVAERRA
jgi:hypothetical protein